MRFFRKKTLKIFSIIVSNIFLFTSTVKAEDNKVVLIEKGQSAPYSGLLFPKEDANKIRVELLELQTLRLLNESYEKSFDLMQKNNDLFAKKESLLLDQNEKLSLALVESRQNNSIQKIIWFSLGILVTGISVYGAKKITQ